MRHFVPIIFLMITSSSCFKAPDYDPTRNPFLSGFEGSFIKQVEGSKLLEDEYRLIYNFRIYPDYSFIQEGVKQMLVTFEANDTREQSTLTFLFEENGRKLKYGEFNDFGVKKGETYTYSFQLTYKKEFSVVDPYKYTIYIED